MKKNTVLLFVLASTLLIHAQEVTTHIAEESMLTIVNDALFYNRGGMQTNGNGRVEVFSKMLIEGKTENDVVRAVDGTNENFFLRLRDQGNWQTSKYGQLFITGLKQNQISVVVSKEFASNKHGDYQQIGLPFFDKEFGTLQTEINTVFTNQRWSKTEILKWNNSLIQFDGSIVPATPINSADTPGITIELTDKTKFEDRASYFALGTGGGLIPENVSVIKGIPYADNLTVPLSPQTVQFGSNGNGTNLYREKFNTYISDIFEIDNPWQQTYGKFIYQFSNPFLTNLDLSLIGIDETLQGAVISDNNSIDNIWGIAVNPTNVRFSTASGTTSNYAANQIVTFDVNNRPVGNINALVIKPLGTFKIKLRNGIPAILNFDTLRRFSNIPRQENINYHVNANRKNSASVKQLGVLLLDDNYNQIGETYYVVAPHFQTGNNENPSEHSVQAQAGNSSLISSYEENPQTGGTDENFATKYRLYINEANEGNFEGKKITMAVYGGKYLKFEIRENGHLVEEGKNLSTNKKFFYEMDGGEKIEINQGDIVPLIAQTYGLYYGTPKTLSSSTSIKANRTVVIYNPSIKSYVVLFDPEWQSAQVNVFDMSGRLIIETNNIETSTPFVIELNNSIKSTYTVQIISNKGETVISKILVNR